MMLLRYNMEFLAGIFFPIILLILSDIQIYLFVSNSKNAHILSVLINLQSNISRT